MLRPEFPSLKSQPDYSGGTGNVQMASHWSLGREASHYVETSRSLAHWPSYTSTEHLKRQMQQQSWQPLFCDLVSLFMFSVMYSIKCAKKNYLASSRRGSSGGNKARTTSSTRVPIRRPTATRSVSVSGNWS